MSTNSGPGYREHAEHRIETKPAGMRVQVTFNGEVIADTRDGGVPFVVEALDGGWFTG
jgi:uncharacterized protein (DUF427 family)